MTKYIPILPTLGRTFRSLTGEQQQRLLNHLEKQSNLRRRSVYFNRGISVSNYDPREPPRPGAVRIVGLGKGGAG